MAGFDQIPLFAPWYIALAMIAVAGLLVFRGYRQDTRDLDINKIPMTSSAAKYFLAAMLGFIGLTQFLAAIFHGRY